MRVDPLILGLVGLLLLLCILRLILIRHQLRSLTRLLRETSSPGAITVQFVDPDLTRLAGTLESQRRRAQEDLSGARAREHELRGLLADISHDLRTPLMAVRGYQDLLDRGELTDQQRAMLRAARRRTAEVSSLVERIFEYAAASDPTRTLEPETVDAAALAEQLVLDAVEEIEAAGLLVELDLEQEAPVVTDREALMRIIDNLVRNAWQHGSSWLRVTARSRSGGVRLTVSNALEPGSAVDAAHLFDRFHRRTAHPSAAARTGAGGAGLGLAIVAALASRLGGEVAAEVAGGTLSIRIDVPSLMQPAPPTAL